MHPLTHLHRAGSLMLALMFMLAVAACGADGEVAVSIPLGGPDAPRYDHSMVWTGEEVVIVGGTRGGKFDATMVDEPMRWTSSAGFESIESPPGDVLARQNAVWTGDEVMLWSGTSKPFGVGHGMSVDAVAWNPQTESWRELAPSPVELGRVFGDGVAINQTVVFAGGSTAMIQDASRIGVYDLAEDQWGQVQVAGAAQGVAAVGDAAYVPSVSAPEGRLQLWRIDPTAQTVQPVATPDDVGALIYEASIAAWGDRIVLLLSGARGSAGVSGGTSMFLSSALGPNGELAAAVTWERVQEPPGETSFVNGTDYGNPLVVVGDWAVTLGDRALVWLHLDTGEQIQQRFAAGEDCAIGNQLLWTGEEFFAWNGWQCSGDGQPITGGYRIAPPEAVTLN